VEVKRLIVVCVASIIAMPGCAASEAQLPVLPFSQFGDPGDSLYCLPYAEGIQMAVNNSYSTEGSHRGRFAYDFAMPFGTEVAAARAGEVTEIRTEYRDEDTNGGHENGVYILHDDGTMAAYLHLRNGGVFVDVGDEITVGQVIGEVGTTGTSPHNPHLHFEVWEGQGVQWYQTLPVNFRNAQGPHDPAQGLVTGGRYLALPCTPTT
jgi:murein DD-endopeptidase MepM/ murein hydrolase activator NlpD